MEQVPENQELATVTRDEDMWILRVETNGKVQEYRCGTEVQAARAGHPPAAELRQQPPDPSPTVS